MTYGDMHRLLPAAHHMVVPTEVLLNDTLVDFWVKYYTAKLLTDEQRRRVHIFNSFFGDGCAATRAATRAA